MPIKGYHKKSMSMLDFIVASAEREQNGGITRQEFTEIRRHGTPEELADAVERMMAAGGYENLE